MKHAIRNSLAGKQKGQERRMQEKHSKKQSGVYSLGQMKMVVAPHLVRGVFGNGRSSKWCVRSRLGEEHLARRREDLQQLLALHSRQAAMAVLGGGGEEGDSGERNMMNSSDWEKISLTVENESNVKDTPDNFDNENDG